MTEVKPFKPHWKMPLWNDVVNGWSYEDPGFPRNPITRAICWILKP